MTEAEKLFHKIAKSLPDAKEGKMFGALCIKAPNGKAGVMFKNENIVFKLEGEAHYEALNLPGACLFDPSGAGRPMKEWVQLPLDYADKWQKFAEMAMEKAGKEKK